MELQINGKAMTAEIDPTMLMAAAALLEKWPKPTDAQIDEAMSNICRCGRAANGGVASKTAAGTAI